MGRPLVAVAGIVRQLELVRGRPEPCLTVPRRYVDAVRRAGGEPVVLDYGEPGDFDAFLLAGGGDVDPSFYGGPPHPETFGVDRERDVSELAVARAAVSRDKPVLAICRGAQVLNVALGGTLVSHLDGHRTSQNAGVSVEVRAEPSSRIGRACGERFDGWCSHHQAIDRLGEGLVATAWAPDGVVEGAELPGGWTVAVQWHPERAAGTDDRQLSLFRAFVDAAR